MPSSCCARDQIAIERQRAGGVVIAGDRIGDALRVAVGVDDGRDRNAETLGFLDRDIFFVGVDDEQEIRNAAHVLDATERAVELVALALHRQALFFGIAAGLARRQHLVELAQPRDRTGDGLPVGQRAAEPARIDEVLRRLLGSSRDRVLRLALGANEQNAAALGGSVAHRLQARAPASARSGRDRRCECCCGCRRCIDPSSGSSGGPDGRSARQLPIADA